MAKNVIAISMQEYAIKMTLEAIAKVKREIMRVRMLVEKFVINREPYLGYTGIDIRERELMAYNIQRVKQWGKEEEARLIERIKFLAAHLAIQRKALAAIKARHARPDYSERGGL